MLIYQGKVLKDNTTIDENKVAENGFVVIMLTKVGSRIKFSRIISHFYIFRFLYHLSASVSVYTHIFFVQYAVCFLIGRKQLC